MPSPSHVVLNALFLEPGVSGGPETYLRCLATALRRTRDGVRIGVVTTRKGALALRASGWPAQGIEVHSLPCDDGQRLRRQAAEQLALPLLARRLRADVLHSLASVAPLRTPGVAHVITLHDVNFMHHTTFGPVTTWGMSQLIPRAATHADALITGSEAARQDICATTGLAARRFTVIPHGVTLPAATTASAGADLRRGYDLGRGPFVLSVGAKRPHKNQIVLIRALAHLDPDMRLVLAGHAETYEQELRRQADALGVADRVRFPGWIPAADLEGLWAAADAAAVPSLAEGFGLPLLEAMARGVPVAASDIPVLREVGGDWPVYFDPHDPRAAAAAIQRLRTDPPDREAGRARAARFTWEATARATWAVYDRATA